VLEVEYSVVDKANKFFWVGLEEGPGAGRIGGVLAAHCVFCLPRLHKSIPDWMQALQELEALVQREHL